MKRSKGGSRSGGTRGCGRADWSHPSLEGQSQSREANSHLVGWLRLCCPGPGGGLLLLLHGCHPLAARFGAHTSSPALHTRGPSLGKRSHVTDAPSLSELAEEKSGGSDGVGGGERQGGDGEQQQRQAGSPLLQDPSFGLPQILGLPTVPAPPPPPENADTRRDQVAS